MKHSLLIPAAIILFTLSFLVLGIKNDGDSEFQNGSKEERIPNDWNYIQRAYPSGAYNSQSYYDALEIKKTKFLNEHSQSAYRSAAWKLCGPTNKSGRITDIERVGKDSPSIFVCTASGGIFKSAGTGSAWYPVFDEQSSLAIGDLAVSPGNDSIMYAGTGEPNAGGGSLAYEGNGVYKTIDGGNTWIHLGLENIGSVGKIVVDPHNPNKCFVAAMGPLFENTNNRGVYRTEDGGEHWDKVLFRNDSTGAIDLAINPLNPDTVYAATWERVRRIDRRSYGGPSSGIFRSFNGGGTWQRLTNGLPTTSGRIGIAISHSNPSILYAIYTDEISDGLKGIYISINNGNNWSELSTDGISDVPYMWWYGKIYIDPTNPRVVYVTSLDMYKSNDGGETWDLIFYGSHVDQHALYIDPDKTNYLLSANDGGIYKSNNGGIFFEELQGIPNYQFYTCEIDQSKPERIYGGAQDNGVVRTFGNANGWMNIYEGDGFKVLVDPVNNTYIYAEYQYGQIARSVNGGSSFLTARKGINGSDRGNWNTPFVFDPNHTTTLYFGTNRLYKSIDRAQNWTVISPDLTKNRPQFNLIFGTITTISVSPLDEKIIYVGTDDGNVQFTIDGGVHWVLVSGSLPNLWVTCVTTDPFDVNTAYITYSGFRQGQNSGHIYKTMDSGVNWMDITGELPDIPVNKILISPHDGHLFVGTDIGVFYSIDAGNQWQLLGEDLPNVVITDLDYQYPENILVAASFGRGMFKFDLDDLFVSISNVDAENNLIIKCYPNPFSENTTIQIDIDLSGYYLISIYDLSGKLIEHIHKQYFQKGNHTFQYDAKLLQHGLYILKLINTGNGQNRDLKMIKG